MKTLFKNILIGGLFIFMVASPVMAVASPQPVAAACDSRVLGIPPWYRGLTNSDCSIKSPDQVGGLSAFVWRIVLNGVEMALALTAYVTVFFMLFGGFLYMTGGAIPSQLERARKTLINAVVGFIICMGSIALTNLIFTIIT